MATTQDPIPSQHHIADRLRQRIGRVPVIGRASELDAIRASLTAAISGAGPSVAMLIGEAGIGKSRLLMQAIADMRASGGAVLLGRCVDEFGTPPFLPWIGALAPASSADSERARLHSALSGVENVDDPGTARLSPGQRKLHLFANVTTYLEARARKQPVLVALDDLHWSDAASNELLRYIVIHAAPAPLLIVGAFRGEEATSNGELLRTTEELHRRRLLTTIPIGPLAATETERYVAALLGHEQRELANAIHDRCEGNPFFIEEVLWMLAVDGKLDDPDTSRPGRPIDVRRLPAPQSVVAGIQRRVDRAAPGCRELLEFAALAGREISIDLLTAGDLCSPSGVAACVEEASRLALIRPTDAGEAGGDWAGDDADFVFAHDRIRKAIDSRINPVRRRALHKHIGRTLEAIGGREDDLGSLAALTHHFSAAHMFERAAGYAEKLGDAAMRSHAHVDAARAYRTAQGIVAKTVTSRGEPAAAAELSIKLGDACLATGDIDGAIDAYTGAEGHFDAAGSATEQAGALRRLGAAYARREEFTLAVTYLQAAVSVQETIQATPGNELNIGLAEILVELGAIQGTSLANYDEAIATGRRGLDLMVQPPGAALATQAHARLALAKSLMRSGDLTAGHACLAPALSLAIRAGDAGIAAESAGALANYHYWRGDLHASIRFALRRRDLGVRSGDPYALRHATPWLANLALAQGNWAEAERLLEEATPQVDRIESPEPYAFLQHLHGLVRFAQGRYDEAVPLLEDAIAGFRSSGPATVVWYLGCLAHAYLTVGDRAARERVTQELTHLVSTLPSPALPRAPSLNSASLPREPKTSRPPSAASTHCVPLRDNIIGCLWTACLGCWPHCLAIWRQRSGTSRTRSGSLSMEVFCPSMR